MSQFKRYTPGNLDLLATQGAKEQARLDGWDERTVRNVTWVLYLGLGAWGNALEITYYVQAPNDEATQKKIRVVVR